MSEVENVNEVVEETSEGSTSTMNPQDYKLIIDMVKEMDEQYNTLKSVMDTTMTNDYGLNTDVLEMILPYTKESITSDLAIEEIREFMKKYLINPDDTRYDELSDNEIRRKMGVVKDSSLLLISTKAEADKLKEESADVLEEYITYLSSEKVQASKEKRLDAMKATANLVEDEKEKKKMNDMIHDIESSMDFSFLQNRISTLGEKEKESIRYAFFNKSKGMYIIDRYSEKITKFGYNDKLYRNFFNIEENFLPEEYHPFNNLFLFIYMRMVAYGDPYNKSDLMFVQSATGAMAKLIYHKFASTENEQEFIGAIKKVLDTFMDLSEYFKENNTTYSEHPVRKAVVKHHSDMRKRALIRKMDELKITGYDKDESIESLQEYYDKKVDEMITDQIKTNEDLADNEELECPDDGEILETETIGESSVDNSVE